MNLFSTNPYTGKTIAEFAKYSDAHVDSIILESAEAFKFWRDRPFNERAKILELIAQNLLNDQEECTKLITSEMGKPIRESRAEIEKCAWVCRYYAENGEKFLKDEKIKTEAYKSGIRFEPMGTILGIMPWNFPFWQVFRFLAPSLMAGNTVLLKHASNVQGCALKIEELVSKSGLPAGVFRVLVLGSEKIKQVIENKTIKAVTLTGSEQAGAIVASQAAEAIKKSVLELGGSNSFIIFDDCDIDRAVDVAVIARFMNGGQSCIAAKRFFVQETISDEFMLKFKEKVKSLHVGDPMKESTDIGPLASYEFVYEVENQIKESVNQGAKVELIGGRKRGFIYPTILSKVKPGMPVFDEEVFGPVAPITVFKSDDEVVDLSNNSEFGLGVTLFTSNLKHAERLIPKFEDGAVFVNSLVKSDPRLPFGGTKKSGYGRELSVFGIREFVNVKTVYIEE